MLLREQLQQLGKCRAGGAGRSSSAAASSSRPPIARLQALSARHGIGEDEYRRTFIRALLAEQLGEQVAQDASFQLIIEDVFRIVSEDEEARSLLDRAAQQLAGSS